MKRNVLLQTTLCILCVATMIACGDDDNTGEMYTPDELVIDGPDEVAPTESATYFANPFPEATYAWTVPNGATITEGEGTSSIEVTFAAGSSGDISVSARGVSGTKSVMVTSPAPMVSVAIDSGTTVLSEGQTGNVIVSFDRDIETAPDIALVADEGSGSEVTGIERVDARTFQLSYAAGTGDGTEQITISNAVATADFGGAAMDTVIAFDVYGRDNTAPTGELFASQTPVEDSMAVTLSAVFSEPLRTAPDSIQVTVESIDVLSDTTYVDGAIMTTEDGMTWTYEFIPSGGRNEVVSISVSNLPPDPAGNPTTAVEPILLQIRNEE